MGEKRNFAALDWVIGEIEETLNEAREALEAYVEDTRDSSRIRFCLTYIHQVLGSLQMVEFHGACLLAEEMEQTAQAIMNNAVTNGSEAQEVLMRSLLQLPIYLEHVKNQKEDQPGVVLPLLNDMRAVRKQSYLSETNLFTPDLSPVGILVGSKHPVVSDEAKLRQVLKKLREMYQFAAAGVLRGIKTRDNLNYLEKVCTRMEALTQGTLCYPTWEVSAAMIESVCRDELDLSVAVRGLLRHLARELRIIEEKLPDALHFKPNESLLKNLLYYVALSEIGSGRVSSVRQRYGLDGANLNGQVASSNLSSDGMSGTDADAVRTVIVALNEEIASIRNVLDSVLSGKTEPASIEDTLSVVKRVGDTLAVLGIGELRKQVVAQHSVLEQLAKETEVDEPRLIASANQIVEVEQRLEAISKVVGTNRDLASVDEREVEIDQAKETVIKECQHGLEQIKDAIVAYHSSKWDKTQLQNVGSLLTNIRGGLGMIPLQRPAAILNACNAYIREQLLDKPGHPAWKSLETLADVITCIEYYLDRLIENVDDTPTLDIAEQSLEMLGYPLALAGGSNAFSQTQGASDSADHSPAPEIPEPQTEFDEFEDSDHLDPLPQPVVSVALPEATEKPAEDQTQPEPSSTSSTTVNDSDDESDIDDEIIEIFVEEAGEVKETLDEYFPQWRENTHNQDALVVVRRAFHTLKGSGRMVEAYDIGELAWSIENMLNMVIDDTVSASPHHAELIQRVITIIPDLIDAFAERQSNPHLELTEQYRAWAKALADGELPAELAASGSEPKLAVVEDAAQSTEALQPSEADTLSSYALEQAAAEIENEAARQLADAEPEPEDGAAVQEFAAMQQDEPEEYGPTDGFELGHVPPEPSREPTEVPEVTAEQSDDVIDEDTVILWEIFSSEARSHLETVEDFIAISEREAPIYGAPSDDLQRALHTLKGSAKMAQVLPIAAMAEPLESFAKELINYQVPVNSDILQLLRDAVTYTELGLQQMDQQRGVEIPRLEQFLARAAELREIAVGHLLRLKGSTEATSQVDPELLSIFMAEEIKLLLAASELLDRWQHDELGSGEVDALIKELNILETGATKANLPELADLSRQLQLVHEQAINADQSQNDDFFDIAKAGHDALLDIIDRIAAGQNMVPPPDEITTALNSLIQTGEKDRSAAVAMPLEETAIAGLADADDISLEGDGDDRPLFSVDIEDNIEAALSEEGVEVELDASEMAERDSIHALDESGIPEYSVVELSEDGADRAGATEIEALVDDELTASSSVVEEIPISDTLVDIEAADSDPLADDEQGFDAAIDLRFDGADSESTTGYFEDDAEPAIEIEVEGILPSIDRGESAVGETVEGEAESLAEAAAELSDGGEAASSALSNALHGEQDGDKPADVGLAGTQNLEAEDATSSGLDSSLEEAGIEFETVEVNFDLADDDLSDEHEVPSFDASDFVPDASALDATNVFDVEEPSALDTVFEEPGERESALGDVSRAGEKAVDAASPSESEVAESLQNNELEQAELVPLAESTNGSVEDDILEIAGLLDDLDTANEDFDADIIDVFLEEANEIVEDLDEAVHSWEADWNNLDAIEEINRALHTLKGGARLAGLNNLGELAHIYESELVGIKADTLDDNFFRKLQAYQDKVLSGVRAVETFTQNGAQKAQASATLELDAYIPVIPAVTAEQEPLVESNSDASETTTDADVADSQAEANTSDFPKVDNSNVLPFAAKPKPRSDSPGGFTMPSVTKPPAGPGGGGAPQVALRKSSGPQEVIKVSADLLEELVNLAGETSISRGRLEEQVSDFGTALDEVDGTLSRLQEQLRRLDIETEAQIIFRQEQMAQDEEFDPLEMDRYSALQQLARSLMESASDLEDLKTTLSDKLRDTETLLLQQSRINTTLQEGLMRSRMVPFSRLVPRLRRIVRQVATELGKSVNFELDNVEGELDRSVLERMIPPLEHMLRNAVDHGIEVPSERIAAGKPESGRIVLALGREGGDVLLRLADDGRGINLKRVRQKAIERGLMSEEADLSDYDIMQFILHAGFSTAENVTQISGRGVGMDVVTSEIKQLGGNVTINSEFGKGTEFVVRLPFTVSVNRALMVAIGKDHYAVPLNTIEGIVRVSPYELEHYYTTTDTRFEYAGENYQVRYLGAMLYESSRPKLDSQVLPLPVLLVRSAEHTMALQVDAVMGSREIVVKSLGSQFASVQGMSGATVMGDGSVVVILDPHALVRREVALSSAALAMLENPVTDPTDLEQQARAAVKTVMVVDDSVTVRKVTSRFLEREGYEVITAKDGVDALRILQDVTPDLMLLDIEMPRMDGFEVAKNVRGTRRWNQIPIIMITSRTGEKHREHALSLGVNGYLGKPYQEDLLLETITDLLETS